MISVRRRKENKGHKCSQSQRMCKENPPHTILDTQPTSKEKKAKCHLTQISQATAISLNLKRSNNDFSLLCPWNQTVRGQSSPRKGIRTLDNVPLFTELHANVQSRVRSRRLQKEGKQNQRVTATEGDVNDNEAKKNPLTIKQPLPIVIKDIQHGYSNLFPGKNREMEGRNTTLTPWDRSRPSLHNMLKRTTRSGQIQSLQSLQSIQSCELANSSIPRLSLKCKESTLFLKRHKQGEDDLIKYIGDQAVFVRHRFNNRIPTTSDMCKV